jgi:hypothetical protein
MVLRRRFSSDAPCLVTLMRTNRAVQRTWERLSIREMVHQSSTMIEQATQQQRCTDLRALHPGGSHATCTVARHPQSLAAVQSVATPAQVSSDGRHSSSALCRIKLTPFSVYPDKRATRSLRTTRLHVLLHAPPIAHAETSALTPISAHNSAQVPHSHANSYSPHGRRSVYQSYQHLRRNDIPL